jgi:hypothetical protein
MTVIQMVKELSAFYGNPEFILLCLQKPATGPYLEQDESSPQNS